MAQAPRSSGAGIAAVVLTVTGFSWGFILIKEIPLPPPVLAFWRVLGGACFLGTIALILRTPWPRPRLVMTAGGAFAAHQLVFIAATKMTSVAIVTTIGATQPLLVLLVSRPLVGERPEPRLYLAALAALGGVALVVLGAAHDASRSTTGDLLAVANVVLFTGYFLAAKRARLAGAPTITFTAGFLLCALPVIAVAMLVWTGAEAPHGGRQLGLLAVLVLGPGNGHLLLNWAHTRVTAALASLILALVPMLSSVWAWAILDESFTWKHAAGIALVIASIEFGRRVEMSVKDA